MVLEIFSPEAQKVIFIKRIKSFLFASLIRHAKNQPAIYYGLSAQTYIPLDAFCPAHHASYANLSWVKDFFLHLKAFPKRINAILEGDWN